MKNLVLSTLAILTAATLYAQPARNVSERASDHNQIQRDEATMARDRAELNQFQMYRKNLAEAVTAGNTGMAHAHHTKLINAMQTEVAQGQAKVDRAQGEVAGSKSEVRSDSREVRHDRRQDKPVQAAGDRQDRRDDIRDVNDDQSDLAELRARHARQSDILAVFQAIQVQGNPNAIAALQSKMALLEEFENTMRRDLGENVEETHEDHRELREDRRETREDIRNR